MMKAIKKERIISALAHVNDTIQSGFEKLISLIYASEDEDDDDDDEETEEDGAKAGSSKSGKSRSTK